MTTHHHTQTTRTAKQERAIKVTKHCRDSSLTQVPWIQMKGKWLQQAGFEIDTPIKVRVMEGCLVLTTEKG